MILHLYEQVIEYMNKLVIFYAAVCQWSDSAIVQIAQKKISIN